MYYIKKRKSSMDHKFLCYNIMMIVMSHMINSFEKILYKIHSWCILAKTELTIKPINLTLIPIEQAIWDKKIFYRKITKSPKNNLRSHPSLFVLRAIRYNSERDLSSDHSIKVWFQLSRYAYFHEMTIWKGSISIYRAI